MKAFDEKRVKRMRKSFIVTVIGVNFCGRVMYYCETELMFPLLVRAFHFSLYKQNIRLIGSHINK
jgi:hypothetical protein